MDTGLLTYARKKCRGSSDSLRACAFSLNTALVPVNGGGLVAGCGGLDGDLVV